jgi:hypothetical protein
MAAGLDRAPLTAIDQSCPGASATSWSEMDEVLAAAAAHGKFVPDADYEHCRALLAKVMESGERAARMRAQADEREAADAAYELALSASTLLGWLGFYRYQWSDDVLGWNERDRAQARNLALVMDKHRYRRAILSAHTSHVAHGRSRADWWGYGDLKSGVHFFRALTGKKVFAIALTAYSASGTQGEWSLPVARNSIDKKLHDAGHRFAFFTAGASFLAEHPTWWLQNGNFPGPYESGVEIVPRDQFDAYFFLDRSHLDKALPQRPIWQP